MRRGKIQMAVAREQAVRRTRDFGWLFLVLSVLLTLYYCGGFLMLASDDFGEHVFMTLIVLAVVLFSAFLVVYLYRAIKECDLLLSDTERFLSDDGIEIPKNLKWLDFVAFGWWGR